MVSASKLRESCFLKKYYLNISVSHLVCKILLVTAYNYCSFNDFYSGF